MLVLDATPLYFYSMRTTSTGDFTDDTQQDALC